MTTNQQSLQNACDYAKAVGYLQAVTDALGDEPDSIYWPGVQKTAGQALEILEELKPYLFPEFNKEVY